MKKFAVAGFVVAVVVCLLFVRTTGGPGEYEFNGQTMGTYYRVIVTGVSLSADDKIMLRNEIEALLKRVNGWMSTFEPESEISLFNACSSTNVFSISPDFAAVTMLALDVARRSEGAFDPTVAPLVDLWGFGKKGDGSVVPGRDKIAELKTQVGFAHLFVDSCGTLRKSLPHLELDLGAVAKGYGVDCVAELLRNHGYVNVLVDIGGEIVAHGVNFREQPWRVSVETPTRGAGIGASHYRILSLSDAAVATSGDYRNYFESGDNAYSHIIDPRSGYPVSNQVASVTVLADNCVTADALATALTVLGVNEGAKLLGQYPGVEAMWIIRDDDGGFSDVMSEGFSECFAD
ncbi:MAG: FAD:protein FMN transferase [Kiritimatiellae bacterium]|nr:FAD:protein FMN transferase [Kiritimatiellia bacterium]